MQTVNWPAILVFRGMDELQFVESNTDLRTTSCAAGDVLVDSDGSVYELDSGSVAAVHLSADRRLRVEEVLELVKKHYSACGQCCVSKMGVPSIAVAIQMVGDLDE